MKDTSDPDQDPGGPVPLAQKSLSDVTGVGLGSHLRGSQLGGSQVSDPSNYMWSHLGLPGANLHPPFHMAALTSHVYSPSFLGHNFTPSALIASLSGRGDHVTRGRPPIPPPLIPPSGGTPTLANLHATLAAGDASRHAELLALLKDSARQHELLFSLSKLAASGPSSSASSCLSSSSSSTSSSSSSFHLPSHQNSPPPKHPHETSPPEKQSLRASSLSPSSYMTPRSLNGSPSAPFAGATPNLGSRMFPVNSLTTLENLSPTSPPTGGEGLNNNSSSGSTPTRKSSTPRPDRVFTCKICSRSFGYKHVLQNHERTHTGEKPFECKECHKRFTRDHHLKTHMRLHTGEKPYHCTHCDRQFVQVANLRRHLRVHTGERPYSCEMCSSKFSDSNQLKAHLLIHKGEKPFECVRCLGKFRRRHHLIYHKCSKDPDAEKGFRDSLSLGNSSFPDGENFGYVETIFPNEEIDDEDLLDEETTSPTPTTTPTTTTDEEHLHSEKRRERKSKEPRRLVPNPPSSMLSPTSDDVLMSPHLPPTPLPEQTEPEDLSMNGSRRSTHRTYRANIALTTSSEYPRYPLQYPSSLEGHPSVDDGQVMVDGYETNNPETLSPNL